MLRCNIGRAHAPRSMKMGECFALVEKEEAETILEELLEKATAKVS